MPLPSDLARALYIACGRSCNTVPDCRGLLECGSSAAAPVKACRRGGRAFCARLFLVGSLFRQYSLALSLESALLEHSFSIAGSLPGYGPTVSQQYFFVSSVRTQGHIRFVKSSSVINDSI